MAATNKELSNKQIIELKKLTDTPEEKRTLSDKQYLSKITHSDSLLEQLRSVSQNGFKLFSVIKDIYRLRKGNGKLTRQDYFLYQLYNSNKYSEDDKARFVSDEIHWLITHKCCDMSWSALTEDKWLSYAFLQSFGVRVPETVAVIDRSLRSFGSTPKISSPDQLKEFFGKFDGYPVFAKTNAGLGSFGAFVVAGSNDREVVFEQSEPLTFDRLFDKVLGEKTYLLQSFVENHPLISTFSPYLATVRMVNLVKPDQVTTPFSAIKIPSPTSIADNYWRKGNIIADVDPQSGVIRRAIRGKGIAIQELETHPETGSQLVGLKLPYWDELEA